MGQKISVSLYEFESQRIVCSPCLYSSNSLRLLIQLLILLCHINIQDKKKQFINGLETHRINFSLCLDLKYFFLVHKSIFKSSVSYCTKYSVFSQIGNSHLRVTKSKHEFLTEQDEPPQLLPNLLQPLFTCLVLVELCLIRSSSLGQRLPSSSTLSS